MEDIIYKIFGIFVLYGLALGAALMGIIWFLVWLFT